MMVKWFQKLVLKGTANLVGAGGVVGAIVNCSIPSLTVLKFLVKKETITMTIKVTYDVFDQYPDPADATKMKYRNWREETSTIDLVGVGIPNSPPLILPKNSADAAEMSRRALQDLLAGAPGAFDRKKAAIAASETLTWIP